MAENKPHDVPPESSSSRCCAVCRGESSWADRLFAPGSHFPVSFPAFYKSRCKIAGSGRRPPINHGWRKKYASLNFTLVRDETCRNDPAVTPDELMAGKRGSIQLKNSFQRNIDI